MLYLSLQDLHAGLSGRIGCRRKETSLPSKFQCCMQCQRKVPKREVSSFFVLMTKPSFSYISWPQQICLTKVSLGPLLAKPIAFWLRILSQREAEKGNQSLSQRLSRNVSKKKERISLTNEELVMVPWGPERRANRKVCFWRQIEWKSCSGSD